MPAVRGVRRLVRVQDDGVPLSDMSDAGAMGHHLGRTGARGDEACRVRLGADELRNPGSSSPQPPSFFNCEPPWSRVR